MKTLDQVREGQDNLGVIPEIAHTFYTQNVDAAADRLARQFFDSRKKILDMLEELA